MAVIESKVKRGYWTNVALSLIPDLLIAWAVMTYNDGGAEAYIFTLVALQAVYFAVWIKRSVWSWLMFWLTNRSVMSNHVEEFLVREQFPKPPDYMSGPDEYFAGIADDADEDCGIRVKAAREVGAFVGVTIAQRLQLAMQMRIATEDAIQRYAKIPAVHSRATERKKFNEISIELPKSLTEKAASDFSQL